MKILKSGSLIANDKRPDIPDGSDKPVGEISDVSNKVNQVINEANKSGNKSGATNERGLVRVPEEIINKKRI